VVANPTKTLITQSAAACRRLCLSLIGRLDHFENDWTRFVPEKLKGLDFRGISCFLFPLNTFSPHSWKSAATASSRSSEVDSIDLLSGDVWSAKQQEFLRGLVKAASTPVAKFVCQDVIDTISKLTALDGQLVSTSRGIILPTCIASWNLISVNGRTC